MKVFKLFFKLAKKYKFYYAFSVVFMVLFTLPLLNLDSNQDQFEKIPLNMTVFDNDKSVFSKDLIQYLENYGTIVPLEDTPQERSDALFNFETDMILTIPNNWGESILNQGPLPKITKQVTSNIETSIFIDTILHRYIQGLQVKQIGFGQNMTDSDIQQRLSSLNKSLQTDIEVLVGEEEDRDLKVHQFGKLFTHYIGYVALMTFIKVIGGIHLSTQDQDIIQRDRMGALTEFNRTSQLWLGSIVWATIFWAILMAVGGIIFGFDIFTQVAGQLYSINAFLCVLGIHAMSYFIAVLAKNEGVLSFLSIALSLMVAFFSGIFVPRSFIHNIGQIGVSIATPIWQVKAIEKISSLTSYNGSQMQEIWVIFAIQILIIFTYFALSYIVQQGRLKHAIIK